MKRNQRSNCQHPLDHPKSKRIPEKLLLRWLCQSLWLCGSQQTVENSSRDGDTRSTHMPPEKPVCGFRSNEPCMAQLISSGSRKEFDRAVCHHSVYLIYMLSTSWEIPGWGSCKLELRYAGETSTTSDMQMIPLEWQKEIQPVHPKGNQSWTFIGRTDAETETSILWPPDVNNWLIWNHPVAGKDWRQEETGKTKDEMVG